MVVVFVFAVTVLGLVVAVVVFAAAAVIIAVLVVAAAVVLAVAMWVGEIPHFHVH